MNAHQLSDSAGRGRTRVGCRLHCSDITANDRGHKSGADLFVTYELHVRRFDHRVCSFDHCHEAFALNHS
jgi:hypothetical protein